MNPEPQPLTKLTPDGRRIVAYNGKGKPESDPNKVTGWTYHPDDLPVHGGRR